MLLSTEGYSICKRYGEEEAFRILKKTGFDACDFSFYYEWLDVLKGDYMNNAKKTKAALDSAGLLCNQAHAPFEIKEGEAFNETCENYLLTVRSIEYAAYLGAKQIIVHLIPTANRDELYAYNQKFYKSLEPYGKKYGIKIAVENDFERRDGKVLPLLGDPKSFSEFVKDLGSDIFVACLDIGHAAMFSDPAEFINNMDSSLLKALHIHDNDLHEDLHLFPMTGNMDWSALCEALKNSGYDGDFTLEPIKGFYKIPIELTEDALYFLAKTGRYLIQKAGK